MVFFTSCAICNTSFSPNIDSDSDQTPQDMSAVENSLFLPKTPGQQKDMNIVQ